MRYLRGWTKGQTVRGDRLKQIREVRQLTQQDLADIVGVTGKQIWRYENALNIPSADILLRLVQELQVSADYLLGLTDDPSGHFDEDELTPNERKLLSAYRRGDLRGLMRVATESAGDQDE